MEKLGQKVFEYASELGKISENTNIGLTRLFLTEEHKKSIKLIRYWMKKAGLKVSVDSIGNVIGRYDTDKKAKTLLIGSHQDSVKNGGIYDGMLGIIIPILCIEELNRQNIKLNYNIEIIAFGDEEGTRFGTAFLSSSALTGSFTSDYFQKTDNNGITLKQALIDFELEPGKIQKLKKNPEDLIGYLELHIEQGPVLEINNIPLGIVKSINTSSRYQITFTGEAGHAGTVPMKYRRDAGTAAAEAIVNIEQFAKDYDDIVATVGQIEFYPGSINVIPVKAEFSLDLRSSEDYIRSKALKAIKENIKQIAAKRNLEYNIKEIFITPACKCDKKLKDAIRNGIIKVGINPFELSSGAGHDAQEMKNLTNIAMMFIRCKKGISHSPKESVTPEDLDISVKALIETLQSIQTEQLQD
jgi:allantoate deiminase